MRRLRRARAPWSKCQRRCLRAPAAESTALRHHSDGARLRASFRLRSGAPLPAADAATPTLPGGSAPPRPLGGLRPPLLALRANQPVCSEALPPNLRRSPARGLGVVPQNLSPHALRLPAPRAVPASA
jgi:hypothetical protein